jgi:hypothetical protein
MPEAADNPAPAIARICLEDLRTDWKDAISSDGIVSVLWSTVSVMNEPR